MSNSPDDNNYLKDLKSMRSKKTAEFAAKGTDLPKSENAAATKVQPVQICLLYTSDAADE